MKDYKAIAEKQAELIEMLKAPQYWEVVRTVKGLEFELAALNEESKRDNTSQVEAKEVKSDESCNCTGRFELTSENNIIYCNKCRKRFIP